MKRKKELIIHIGMYKTGSTSIQESLKRQGEGIDYCYFDFENPNHIYFCKLFMGKDFTFYKKNGINKNKIEQNQRKIEKMFVDKIKKCNKQKMLLSAECSTDMTISSLCKAKRFFENYFEKITIVAYVRGPKSYIESAFQQVVKGGEEKFNLKLRYPSYRKRFLKFDKVFRSKNVKLWRFDPKALHHGDVVKDILYRLRLKIDDHNIVRVNEAIPTEIVSLLYLMNKYSPAPYRGPKLLKENNLIHSLLKEKLLNGKGTKFRFSKKLIEGILKERSEDIAWMEKRLGEPLLAPDLPVGADSENVISCEEDLFKVKQEIVEKIYTELALEKGRKGEYDTPQSIAKIFSEYRKKILNDLSN